MTVCDIGNNLSNRHENKKMIRDGHNDDDDGRDQKNGQTTSAAQKEGGGGGGGGGGEEEEEEEETTTILTTAVGAPTSEYSEQKEKQKQQQQHQQAQQKQPKEQKEEVLNNKIRSAQEEVQKAESKFRKIMVRVVSGALMINLFALCTYMGHVYICALVALVELLLFRELVKVRYKAFFDTIEDTIPLFRTTQWMWFAVAIFYTYGDFIMEVIQGNPKLHYLLPLGNNVTGGIVYYLPSFLSFCLYSGTFVLTIATMQVGHIKFQLNQLCWTIVVLCLTVGQLKYIMHNIFNGLFWFVLPILLVVTNDIMAYVSGMTCGRKFIQRPFISFSPNKTWEGFIGGWIFTMITSWYLSRFLAQCTWMTCPTNEFRLLPEPLSCDLDPIFQQAQSIFPTQIFELLPRSVVKLIPGIVEICAVKGPLMATTVASSGPAAAAATTTATTTTAALLENSLFIRQEQHHLTRCISGEESHMHHHFVLILKDVYPIQIHALWLALFASLVAPFGGFLASAIKRAYSIKDFDSIIPGHGGVMDRMDCQFLMALYTWVHYNTFVRLATVSVPKLLYMYSLLNEKDKMQFLEQISLPQTINTVMTTAVTTAAGADDATTEADCSLN